MFEGQSELFCLTCGANDWKVTQLSSSDDVSLICKCGEKTSLTGYGDCYDSGIFNDDKTSIWEFEKDMLNYVPPHVPIIEELKTMLKKDGIAVEDWKRIEILRNELSSWEQRGFNMEVQELIRCITSDGLGMYNLIMDEFRKLLKSGSGLTKDWNRIEHMKRHFLSPELQTDFNREAWELMCDIRSYPETEETKLYLERIGENTIECN